jgi:hypothetical protein
MGVNEERDALRLAESIALRKAEHVEPAAWRTAVELQRRGWHFIDFEPTGVTASPTELDRPQYAATLGQATTQNGETMKVLVACCLSWENGEARRKPEFRNKAIPATHPLAHDD